MKILLIHHRLPYPLLSGMDKVTYNLIRVLNLKHEVTLVLPVNKNTVDENIKHISNICHKFVGVPVNKPNLPGEKYSFRYWWRLFRLLFHVPLLISENYYPEMVKVVQRLCGDGKYDLVQAVSIATAEYLQYAGTPNTAILAHDVAFELARTQLRFIKKPLSSLINWLNYRAFLHFESKVYLNAKYVLSLSEIDLKKIKEKLKQLQHPWHLKVPVEPNDNLLSEEAKKDPQEANTLIFVGGLGPFFNQDAVLYFSENILPTIFNKIPSARFFIVGENPPEDIKLLQRDRRIIVTGRVPDVRPYITRSAVYVAPVRFGGGIKTKMIEAFSLGKAIVATPVAVSGLWDINEKAILIRDDPIEFADEVIRLLENKELRCSLEVEVRKLFERSYSFEAIAPKLLSVYDEIDLISSRQKA